MKMLRKMLKKINQGRPIKLISNYVQYGTEFRDKTVLVIGGGTGIGRAIAEELVSNGARVVICGRKCYRIEHVSSEILDVSNIEALEVNLANLLKKYIRFDIVVNSQGICPDVDFRQSFYDVTQSDFEKVMRVNFESVYFVNKYFCQYFEHNNIAGNILNICSTEGLKGCVVPYGLSKAAVISFTKGLGKRMASRNIVINGIAPGVTATDMMNMHSDGDLRIDYVPSLRASLPIEIAKTAHLLLSDAGRQMCGAVIVVDGGESLK